MLMASLTHTTPSTGVGGVVPHFRTYHSSSGREYLPHAGGGQGQSAMTVNSAPPAKSAPFCELSPVKRM